MLLGVLDRPGTYESLLSDPVWVEAIAWIKRMPDDQAEGNYPLRGEEMHVNVHSYETLSREACRYESHKHHVDLQYCIEGSELIEWSVAHALTPNGEYDGEKDIQWYEQPAFASTKLTMEKGCFAVFFPEDAHMPKIAYNKHLVIRKLVVKVSTALFTNPLRNV